MNIWYGTINLKKTLSSFKSFILRNLDDEHYCNNFIYSKMNPMDLILIINNLYKF